MIPGLIVIDVQTAAFEATAAPKHDAAGTIARINRLAQAVRAANGSVLFVQHDGPPGDAFQPGAPGWQLWPALDRKPDDLVVRKTACDSFLGTTLDATLHDRAIDQLIITGWATDYCVDTTVRAALARVESEMLKNHLNHCIEGAIVSGNANEQRKKAGELIELLDRATR